MSGLLPPRVRPGQRARADQYNRVLELLSVLLNVRPAKGIYWRLRNGGIDIGLVPKPEIVLPGIIEAVNAPGGDASGAQDLNEVTYDVRIRERPEFNILPAVTPHYRTPDLTVDGQPAQVGDDCFVFLRILPGGTREARVWAFTEKVIHFECEAAAAAAGNGQQALVGLQAEMARLRAMVGNADAEALVSSVLPPLMLGGVGGGPVNG